MGSRLGTLSWMVYFPISIIYQNCFKDNPLFTETKIIYSIYNDEFSKTLGKKFIDKIKIDGISDEDLKYYKEANYINITKAAIDNSDALIIGSEEINPEIEKYLKDSGKPYLEYQSEETYIDAYNEFYDQLLES